jgi:hypothetical protein
MPNKKRLIIATLMGFFTGLICYGFAWGGLRNIPFAVALQIILTRSLAGFAIGISIFKMGHWSIHGAVIGFLFSLPLAFDDLMSPPEPEFTKLTLFLITVVMGTVYGLLIEFVTTILFDAKNPVMIANERDIAPSS